MVAIALCLTAGCKLKAMDDDGSGGSAGTGINFDPDDFIDDVKDAASQLDDLEICPGYTAQELLKANSLSEECREALLSFLPDPEATFEDKLLSPGGLRADADGNFEFLLQGVNGEGVAISAEALASAEISITTSEGTRVLEQDEYSITLTADLPTDLLSISVVNDYSASMFDADLRDVEEAERTLFMLMPPIHETEVIRFSTEVETTLPFGTDADALDMALTYDDSFERETTALLDGLGTGVTSLGARERPVKILILSTDGGENASTMYEQAEVFAALDEHHVFVIALGALLADVDFMRDLTRERGVFVYTREFNALLDTVQPLLESLEQMVQVELAELDPPPDEVHVMLDGQMLTLTPVD
jgi:hypothetical protein